jgi:hypothetical protein
VASKCSTLIDVACTMSFAEPPKTYSVRVGRSAYLRPDLAGNTPCDGDSQADGPSQSDISLEIKLVETVMMHH